MLAPVPGYINAKAFTEAGEICEQVFQSYKYASDPVMAETLTYLHTCCINGYPVPKAFSSIEDIEKQAYYYGSIYSSQKRTDIKAIPVPSKAATSGFFTANCKNNIFDWIEKTRPENYEASVSSEPEAAILPHVHQRILLIHNDFNINLQDALNILDRIKKNISTEKETTISDWKNFELYIRCNEEEATPVLDTALSYFTENNEIRSSADFSLIKIYLIDEILTPDSSRFWPLSSYEVGMSPPSFDKQYVRGWLSAQPWDKTAPAPRLPLEVAEKTTEKYNEALRLLTA